MCKFCDNLASYKEYYDNPERKKNKYIYTDACCTCT